MGEKTDFVAFLDGIKLVHSQFLTSLGNFGVTAIDSSEGTSSIPVTTRPFIRSTPKLTKADL